MTKNKVKNQTKKEHWAIYDLVKFEAWCRKYGYKQIKDTNVFESTDGELISKRTLVKKFKGHED